MTFNRFEDIIAWQEARELTRGVYAATREGSFAKDFGLVDQIRRAAVSVGSNIAEGFDRGNTKEFLTFLGIAKGSVAEVRSQLYTALDVGHIDQAKFDELYAKADQVAKLLAGLIKSTRVSNVAGVRYNATLPTLNAKP